MALAPTTPGARLPAGWPLWLDGGHNAAAAEVLVAIAREGAPAPLYLVFGALSSRVPGEFLKPVAP